MNDATHAQFGLIGEMAAALDGAGVRWWLYGGWAMDFHAGALTRDHSDIELFMRIEDAAAARTALTAAGFAAFPALHPGECQPFLKEGQEVGAWYLTEDGDGRTITPGRWADWAVANRRIRGPARRARWHRSPGDEHRGPARYEGALRGAPARRAVAREGPLGHRPPAGDAW